MGARIRNISLLLASACGALLATAFPLAQAADDAATRQAAEKLATNMCSACHGQQGRGDNPRIPRLAGQQRAYLEVQLKAFRSQSRADHAAHEYMWGVAATLDDAVIAALATYYSRQPAASPSAVLVNREAVAKGAVLYAKGSPERGVPPCTGCHGANAEGLAVFPRLAGQHGEYLFIQMQSIRNRLRASPVMHGLIKELADEEIVALAAFLESK